MPRNAFVASNAGDLDIARGRAPLTIRVGDDLLSRCSGAVGRVRMGTGSTIREGLRLRDYSRRVVEWVGVLRGQWCVAPENAVGKGIGRECAVHTIDRRDEVPKHVAGTSVQVMRCLILLSGFCRAVLSRRVWIDLRRALSMLIRSGSSLPCISRGQQGQ